MSHAVVASGVRWRDEGSSVAVRVAAYTLPLLILSISDLFHQALEVIVWHDGKEYQQKYSRGKPVTTLICHELPDESKDRQGTHIKFWPDKKVFTAAIQFDYPTIAGRIRELAFLNPEVEAQYAVLKEECHQLFPIVGSGRFITAPVITEDGDPIQDPIVLLEANPDKGLATVSQENAPCSSTMVKEVDKKIIQWKLTLHQIGLDVVRTDRTLVFYEKQENLSKLWDIHAVYAWFDIDVGYCQVCLLVKGWKGTSWSFPRGKKNKDEEDHACAVREVLEGIGFDVSKFLNKDDDIEMIFGQQRVRLYIIAGVKDDTAFAPLTKKEISEIAWQRHDEIQPANEDVISRGTTGLKLYMVAPFLVVQQ
ncbi:unnamed protein product [Camellia sinensis]